MKGLANKKITLIQNHSDLQSPPRLENRCDPQLLLTSKWETKNKERKDRLQEDEKHQKARKCFMQ